MLLCELNSQAVERQYARRYAYIIIFIILEQPQVTCTLAALLSSSSPAACILHIAALYLRVLRSTTLAHVE